MVSQSGHENSLKFHYDSRADNPSPFITMCICQPYLMLHQKQVVSSIELYEQVL
jgi:hypothetical protein